MIPRSESALNDAVSAKLAELAVLNAQMEE